MRGKRALGHSLSGTSGGKKEDIGRQGEKGRAARKRTVRWGEWNQQNLEVRIIAKEFKGAGDRPVEITQGGGDKGGGGGGKEKGGGIMKERGEKYLLGQAISWLKDYWGGGGKGGGGTKNAERDDSKNAAFEKVQKKK